MQIKIYVATKFYIFIMTVIFFDLYMEAGNKEPFGVTPSTCG